MTSISIDTALVGLYNATRKAPLTLAEHDENRMFVDVLAQALKLNISWATPVETPAPPADEEPKRESVIDFKPKKRVV